MSKLKFTARIIGKSAGTARRLVLGSQPAITPESIKPHRPQYKDGSWRYYKIEELGNWVALLTKRSTHRTDPIKRAKDLYDARNYWEMMGAQLDALEKRK